MPIPEDICLNVIGSYNYLWDQRQYGDCGIHLKLLGKDAGIAALGQLATISVLNDRFIKCHTAVLQSGSQYFANRLQPNCEGHTKIALYENEMTSLVVELPVENLRAFEDMVKFMYLTEINQNLSTNEYLRLLQVAIEFGADLCCAAIVHLLYWKVLILQEADLNAICCMKCSLACGWDELQKKVVDKLMNTYGKAVDVLTVKRRLADWCRLSWGSVRSILTHGHLKTDGENTVACLLDQWLRNNKGMLDPQNPQCQEVLADIKSNILHYGQLTGTFLNGLNHDNSWAKLPPAQFKELCRLMQESRATFNAMFSEKRAITPFLWYSARPHQTRKVELSCTHTLPEARIRAAVEKLPKPSSFNSKVVYSDGWYLKLILQISTDMPCGVFFFLECASPTCAVKQVLFQNAEVVLNEVKQRAMSVGPIEQPKETTGRLSIKMQHITLGCNQGTNNFLELTNPADWSQWRPFMYAEKFSLKGIVQLNF